MVLFYFLWASCDLCDLVFLFDHQIHDPIAERLVKTITCIWREGELLNDKFGQCFWLVKPTSPNIHPTQISPSFIFHPCYGGSISGGAYIRGAWLTSHDDYNIQTCLSVSKIPAGYSSLRKKGNHHIFRHRPCLHLGVLNHKDIMGY